MRRARGNHDGGFAMVEAVAVLLLSTLVLLALILAVGLVTRSSAMVTNAANRLDGMSTGLAAFRRDIAATQFARAGPGPGGAVLFQGTPSSLAFVVAEGGSETLVRIEARSENGRGTLVRYSAALPPLGANFEGVELGNPVVLLSGPWGFRLTYAAAGRAPLAWQESWSSRKALPQAVRLEILDPRRGGHVLAPTVAVLRVNAEAGCWSAEGCDAAESAEEPAGEGADATGGG